jgi:hypothetical protein
MRNRSTWLASLISVFVCGVLAVGVAAPSALAAPKGKPGITPPGVPPGQPFQALQRQIDGLDKRVDVLEAAAPQPGLMWINPLDFRAGASTLSLDLAGPGLVVTGAAAGADVVQVGLQVPLGFSVTGAKVCYVSGATSYVSSVQLLQYGATPTLPPATLLSSSPAAPTANTLVCVDPTPIAGVDPSAGGAMFLSLGVTFGAAADAITIRAVGLHLEPTP